MAKFYKPGRVVIVTNGKYAGKKAIIVRSNFDQTKTRKYPHCLVLGLKKFPRRVTKNTLKRFEAKLQRFNDSKCKVKSARQERLKRMGVFVKTYNMAHLLATRYKILDNFGIEKQFTELDRLEGVVKDLNTKLSSKTKEDKPEDIKKLEEEVGVARDNFSAALDKCKVSVGTELYNRFMKGFERSNNAEENDKIASSEFLFTKLKF